MLEIDTPFCSLRGIPDDCLNNSGTGTGTGACGSGSWVVSVVRMFVCILKDAVFVFVFFCCVPFDVLVSALT